MAVWHCPIADCCVNVCGGEGRVRVPRTQHRAVLSVTWSGMLSSTAQPHFCHRREPRVHSPSFHLNTALLCPGQWQDEHYRLLVVTTHIQGLQQSTGNVHTQWPVREHLRIIVRSSATHACKVAVLHPYFDREHLLSRTFSFEPLLHSVSPFATLTPMCTSSTTHTQHYVLCQNHKYCCNTGSTGDTAQKR